MKKYIYSDGFYHRSEEYLSAETIKNDEKEHGELLLMADGSVRIYTDNRNINRWILKTTSSEFISDAQI